MRSNFLLVITFWFISTISVAFELQPKAGFVEEEIRIAENVHFWMSIKHPKNIQLVFPDSTHSFAPFEYVNKQYFRTETTDSISIDSAVYTLTTFEIERLQKLKLPVYILNGNDSITINSPVDTVFFQGVITQLPRTIKLRQDTSFQKVDYDFNYYYALIICFVLIVIIGIILFLGKKTIALRYYEYLLTKNHKKFLLNFSEYSSSTKINEIQQALLIWKNYLGNLENQPFHSYTSKDLHAYYNHEILYKNLQKVDYYIYAHPTNEFTIEGLESFAINIFESKKEELKAKYGR